MSGPALAAVAAAGIDHEVVRHGPARSLPDAARNQGVEVRDVVKTLVVRQGPERYVFVLVPGDRVISWPKLRALLGVNRLSMPDAATARDATGYERGTITPFGSATAWPVIADATIPALGTVAIGGGGHGINLHVDATALVGFLRAELADVTKPDDR